MIEITYIINDQVKNRKIPTNSHEHAKQLVLKEYPAAKVVSTQKLKLVNN